MCPPGATRAVLGIVRNDSRAPRLPSIQSGLRRRSGHCAPIIQRTAFHQSLSAKWCDPVGQRTSRQRPRTEGHRRRRSPVREVDRPGKTPQREATSPGHPARSVARGHRPKPDHSVVAGGRQQCAIGEKATEITERACPRSTRRGWHEARSHRAHIMCALPSRGKQSTIRRKRNRRRGARADLTSASVESPFERPRR